MREFSKRLRKIGKGYVELLNRIPSEPAVNQRYTFRLDQNLLSMLLQNGESLVDDVLLQGGEFNLWFWQDYVSTAYQRGTAQEFSNLSQQSATYAADWESLDNILLSEAYQSRLILVRAREFEEMKGLSNQVKANLSRVLTDGIGRGLNPRDVARNITAQTDIERSRANRIARTEITTALRRARWDEHEQAKDDLGLNVMLMHISALSPTTRQSHALRHGHLYTSEQVREWYSVNANAINCYLPGTEVQGRFVAGSKAKYSGDVIEIVTAAGRRLTVTPNHPILTSRGMIAATEVRKGDYAVAYIGDIENPAGVSHLDVQNVKPLVEDVFSSLMEFGHSYSRGVVAVDFHGDGAGMDENVSVVVSDRVLTFACDAKTGEALDYLALVNANPVITHPTGALNFSFGAISCTSSASVSERRPEFTEIIREGLVAEDGCFGITTLTKSVFLKKPGDRDAGESDAVADALNGFTSHMAGEKFISTEFISDVGLSAFHHASPTQPAMDGLFSNTQVIGDKANVIPPGISLDEIINVRRREFFGHVYDLQEASGLMVANGIISSNCKCSQVTIMVDDKGEPLNPSVVEMARKEFKQTWGDKLSANQSHHCCGDKK